MMILVVIFILINGSYLSMMFLVLLGLTLAKLMHSRLLEVIDHAIHILPLLIILFAWIPFFKGSTVLTVQHLGPFTIRIFQEGLDFAVLAFIRGISAILVVLSFTSSMSMQEFTEGLRTMYVPASFVSIIILTLRYFPLIFSEASKTRTAQSLRGVDSTNWRTRFKAMAALSGIVFIRSLTGAERIYDAMLLRGFKRSIPIRIKRPSALEFSSIFGIGFLVLFIFIGGQFGIWHNLWTEVWKWIQ